MRRALALAVALIGCGDPALRGDVDTFGEPPHATRSRAVGPELSALSRVHMHRRFDDLALIEHALIAGKLREAQALAFLLAKPPSEAWMAPWPADTAAVERAALALALAPSFGEACRREPQIAAACAKCHVDARSLPFHTVATPVPGAQAAQHRWAVDRMREGLVHAADERWRRGLEALARTPAPDGDLANGVALATQLQAVARARLEDRAGDRTAAYGELLATCAACHSALGR